VPTGFPGEGRGPSSKRHFFQKICPITVEARFKVGWTFEGAKHFISQNEKLASHRPWLLQLFAAIEGENRAAILAGLREARASFQTVGK